MRCRPAALAGVLLLVGCAKAPPSVVGTWQAFLGDGTAAKLYFGRPEPTTIEFRDDGTYFLHLMWGTRSLAQVTGNYRVVGNKVELTPWSDDLDRNVWPGNVAGVLDEDEQSMTIPLPRTARMRQATFRRLR